MADGSSAPGRDAGKRPVIAIPARFSASASALRYGAVVCARKLAAAVFAAGAEPFILHPVAPGAEVGDNEVRARLALADGLLLPGGGDLSSHWYGQDPHPTLYDVDAEQDAFDLAAARVALADGIPTLAICRGMQVVNVSRGGTIVQDMAEASHRHHVHEMTVDATSPLGAIVGAEPSISCFHHQCLDRVGDGLHVAARAEDGVIEAITAPDSPGWFLGVQWHPEDTADSDPVQAAVFEALVAATREAPARG